MEYKVVQHTAFKSPIRLLVASLEEVAPTEPLQRLRFGFEPSVKEMTTPSAKGMQSEYQETKGQIR